MSDPVKPKTPTYLPTTLVLRGVGSLIVLAIAAAEMFQKVLVLSGGKIDQELLRSLLSSIGFMAVFAITSITGRINWAKKARLKVRPLFRAMGFIAFVLLALLALVNARDLVSKRAGDSVVYLSKIAGGTDCGPDSTWRPAMLSFRIPTTVIGATILLCPPEESAGSISSVLTHSDPVQVWGADRIYKDCQQVGVKSSPSPQELTVCVSVDETQHPVVIRRATAGPIALAILSKEELSWWERSGL